MSYLNFDSRMPFGPYKGKEMREVPYKYFLKLWNENRFRSTDELRVKEFISKNMDAIRYDRIHGQVDPMLDEDW